VSILQIRGDASCQSGAVTSGMLLASEAISAKRAEMDFEESVPLQIPLATMSEGDEEGLNDRLTMFAEYVEVEQLFPESD
jgi:hypothetical protein